MRSDARSDTTAPSVTVGVPSGGCDWVRVVVVGPADTTVLEREIEDPWYRAGSYRHPDHHRQARHDLAKFELREWLGRSGAPDGRYEITVTELLSPPAGRRPVPSGQVWACVVEQHSVDRSSSQDPPTLRAADENVGRGAAA